MGVVANTSGYTFAQVIDYSTKVTLIKDRKRVLEEVTLQINGKEDLWLTEYYLPYDVSNEPEIEAQFLDANGLEIKKLKNKHFSKTSDFSYDTFHSDDKIMHLDLSWHTYPYKIKLSISEEYDQYLFLVNWSPYFKFNAPTKQATLQIEIPNNISIALDTNRVDYYTSVEMENSTQFTWKFKNLEKIKGESFAPPLETLMPYVRVVPQSFNYKVQGNASSWSDFGNWVHQLNMGKDVLTLDEQLKVDALLNGVTDKKEQVKILYYYLQDVTRYINVDIGYGGLEPYPASYVCKNKFGDCKALSVFMKALLKHKGIESFLVDIHAGSKIKRINKNVPSQQFNHVILAVPLETDTLWLENTSSTTPFNYLGTFTQNRLGLLVDGHSSRLVKTPALQNNEVREHYVYEVNIKPDHSATFQVKAALKGPLAMQLKSIDANLSGLAKKEYLIQELNWTAFEKTEVGLEMPDRDSAKVKVRAVAKASSFVRDLGPLSIIKPVSFKLDPLRDPSERKQTVAVYYPIHKISEANYHLPNLTEDFEVKLPENVRLEHEMGYYEVICKKLERSILIKKTFQLYSTESESMVYDKLFSFLSEVKQYEAQNVIQLIKK